MKKNSRRYGFWALLSCGVLGATFGAATSGLAQNPFASKDGGNAQRLLSRDATPMEIPSLSSDSATRPLDVSRKSLSSLTQSVANAQDDLESRLAELGPEERAAAELYLERNKCVVNVSTTEQVSSYFSTQVAEGCGSGVVLNKEGIILTNFHVVEKATTVKITLFNGETYPAKPIAVDPNTDIAIVKVDAPKDELVPVVFGDSSRLLVGQIVYAIGNPFGLERTMTKGIISNLNRSIDSPQQFRRIKGVIQTDAAINPGNSGGALFDSKGRMVGMNTAIASRVGENSGIGFAVPVNTVHRIVSILLEKGQVVRGDAGVVQVTETENGLIPALIDDKGSADNAGLRGGKLVVTIREQNGVRYQTRKVVRPDEGFDLITGVNDQPVKTGEDFITAVEEHEPGETLTLNVLRNGKEIRLPLVLK